MPEPEASPAARIASELLELREPRARDATIEAEVRPLTTEAQDEVAEVLRQIFVQDIGNDPARAERAVEAILAIADATARRELRAFGLSRLAQLFAIRDGDLGRALTHYAEAAKIYEEAGDVLALARLDKTRVAVLGDAGRLDEAIARSQAAARVFKAEGAWNLLASLHRNTAIAYMRNHHYAEALSLLRLADDAFAQSEPEEVNSRMRGAITRAVCLMQLGRFREALELGDQIISDCTQWGLDHLRNIQVLNSALVLYCTGRYTQALAHLDRIRQLAGDESRSHLRSMAQLAASDCLLLLGRFVEVLDSTERLTDEFAKRGDLRSRAQTQYDAALALAGLGRLPEALSALEFARETFAELDDPVWSRAVDWVAASVALQAGDLQSALDLSARAVEAFGGSEISTSIEAFQVRVLRARVLIHSGRLAEAQQALEELREPAEHQGAAWQYPVATLRAEMARAEGNIDAAIEHFRSAIDWLEQIQVHVALELRADFLTNKLDGYRQLVSLLLDRGRTALAFEYATRARSACVRAAVPMAEIVRPPSTAPEQPVFDQEVTSLLEERDRLVFQLRQGAMIGTNSNSITPKDPLFEQLAEIEERLRDRWRIMVVRQGEYARRADFWQIQGNVQARPALEDEILVEFFRSEGGQLIAFVLDHEDIVSLRLDCDEALIRRLVAQLDVHRGLLQTFGHDTRAVPLTQRSHAVLARLYDLLLRPMAPLLGDCRPLAIVPCGALNQVPFAALYQGSGYLIEDRSVTILPGAQLLHHALAELCIPARVVAVGFDCGGALPQAEVEAREVAGLWSGTALIGQDATRKRVREALEDADIVHLATHAMVHPAEPMLSGIELADGWLTAMEIAALHVRSSLVVLSACYTGAAQHGAVDEVQGLERALVAAGVGSIVSSIGPELDRAAGTLLARFHTHLVRQPYPAEALRLAMLDAASADQDSLTRHPAMWAGFKVFARHRTAQPERLN